MFWGVFIPLLLCVIYAILHTREDPRLSKLKEMYAAFLTKLPPKYDSFKKRTILTGTHAKGTVGYNVNKGSEILVCIDGEVNDMFHVLLHELAHSSVKEYDHSGAFWENYKELSDIAVKEGFYTPGVRKEFCGQMISDGLTSSSQTGEQSKTRQQ